MVSEGYELTAWVLWVTGRTAMDLSWGKFGSAQACCARHSLLNARGTGSLSLVSWTVDHQGLSNIWNSLAFFIVR